MMTFVCWKWATGGKERVFQSAHVNVLRSMIERHYPRPHRLVCITDDPVGLDERIEPVPMPVTLDTLRSPSGARFPNCFRRLWVFSEEARKLGERLFCTDIDVVITGDLRPLVDRDEDFVGWCDEDAFGWPKIAGGCYLLRTGTMRHVWDEFDPLLSPAAALAAGNSGSDQGWMSYRMYPPAGRWSRDDGLVKLKWTPPRATAPPPDVRMAFTTGLAPPWSAEVQRMYPWLREHWR